MKQGQFKNLAGAALIGFAALMTGCGPTNVRTQGPGGMAQERGGESPVDAAYNAAKNSDSPGASLSFLERFADDSRAEEIRQGLEGLEFRQAKESKDPMSLEFFLKAYSVSHYATAARNLLKDRLYAQAKSTGDVYAYKAYLRRFPYDERAPEIRQIIGSAGDGEGHGEVAATINKILSADEFVARYSCAMVLVAAIRSGQGGSVDRMRTQIVDLAQPGAGLPDACSGASQLSVDPQDRGAFLHAAGALQSLLATQAQVNHLAKTLEQHGKLLLNFVGLADRKVAEFEEQEFSDQVLQRRLLGDLDLGADAKGSATAKETVDQLKPLAKQAAANISSAQKLKKDAALHLEGVELYLAELLTAKS